MSVLAKAYHLGFTKSSDVSDYIMNNNLGYKYKNISGVVTMTGVSRKGQGEWNFKGGISPHIYGELCYALRLEGNRSKSKVKDFTAFSELKNKKYRSKKIINEF